MKLSVGKQNVRRNILPAGVFRILFVLLVLAVTACSDDEDATEASPCLLTKVIIDGITYPNSAVPGNYTDVVTYQYDDAGNLVASGEVYEVDNGDGGKYQLQSQSTKEYDAEGFLVKSYFTQVSSGTDVDDRSTKTDETFAYENGRLKTHGLTHSANGVPTIYSTTYEYDADGKLLKTVSTDYVRAIQYSGSAITAFTDTYKASGAVYAATVTFNDRGQLLKSVYGMEENRYEYTPDGDISLEEHYVNGPAYAGSSSFDTKRNAYQSIYAARKGVPFVPSMNAEATYVHNVVKFTSLLPNDAKTGWDKSNVFTFVYSYNDKDFPVTCIKTIQNGTGVTLAVENITYEYSNCR